MNKSDDNVSEKQRNQTMLIFTRKAAQSIIIGEDIEVTVLKVGDSVRLAINAPFNMKVSRKKPRNYIQKSGLTSKQRRRDYMKARQTKHMEQ